MQSGHFAAAFTLEHDGKAVACHELSVHGMKRLFENSYFACRVLVPGGEVWGVHVTNTLY